MKFFNTFKYLFLIALLVATQGGYANHAFAEQQEGEPTKKIKAFYPPKLDFAKVCISQAPTQIVVGAKTSHLSPAKKLRAALELLNGGVGAFPDPVRAIRLFRELAETKTPQATRAKMQLARLYLSGTFLAENRDIAMSLLLEIAPGDSFEAGYLLGRIYQKLSEYETAEEYYKRAALAGNPMGYVALAYMYRDELIPGQSQQRIDQLITLSENRALEQIGKGNCRATHDFGKAFLRDNISLDNHPAGVEWLTASALAKNSSAISFLGGLYLNGTQVEKNIEKGLHYYELGSKYNNAESLYRLGDYWLHKRTGLAEDRLKASEYLSKAAAQGHQKAIEKLARYYSGDYDDRPQHSKVIELLERAVNIPDINPEIIYMLAESYQLGEAGTQDDARAFELYDRAAKQNYRDAMVKLGDAYKYGVGVKRTPMKSYRFYRQAASLGSRDAIVALVENYECGVGRAPSPRYQNFWKYRAIHEGAGKILRPEVRRLMLSKKKQDNIDGYLLLKRRVSDSDREAMVMLSHFYNQGIGVEKNQTLAQKWLKEAIQDGEYQSKGYVAMGEAYLDDKMFGVDLLKAKQYFEKALTFDDNDNAGYELGKLLREGGKEFAADKAAAADAFLDAVNKNNDNAMRKLADLLIEQGRDEEGVALLKRSIALNNLDSIMDLTDYYLRQPKTDTESFKQANYWFNKAATSYPCTPRERVKLERLTTKINSLAGSVIITNPAEVKEHAEQGNMRAMRQMAKRHIYGSEDTEANPKLALKWYLKAAKAGDAVSMMEIGNAFSTGLGVKPSKDKAREWWQRAAKAGNDKAKKLLEIDSSVVDNAPAKKPH